MRFLIITATLNAQIEVESEWEFRMVNAYTKEEQKQNMLRGDMDPGSSEEKELLITNSGLAVSWKASFVIAVQNLDGDDFMNKGRTIASEEEANETQDKTLRKYGFKQDSDGNFIMAETNYKKESFDEWSTNADLYYVDTNGARGVIIYNNLEDDYGFYTRSFEKNAQLRQEFREFDQEQMVFSKKKIIYPEYRQGPIQGE